MKFTKLSKTICLALFALHISPSFAQDSSLIPVTIEKAHKQAFTSSINEVGKIRATDSAALTFSASEKILNIHFKDGDSVEKGELIAQLDNTKAKADLDKARSSLALAKSKLKRVQELLKKQPDSMSQQDVEELGEQANLAAADFRQKEALMNDYLLVAPFDGQLTNFTHSVGSKIDSATALVSLIKLDPVEVQYSIGQSDLGHAKLGQNVSIQVDAFVDEAFSGVVDYIAPAVDESSGRVEVHAHVTNPEHRLVPGMFAKVSQMTSEDSTQMVVSQNSVQAKDAERFVWVVNGEKIEQRFVELGVNTNDGYVVVEKGLKLGDDVVVTGQQNLKKASLVKVMNPDAEQKTVELVKEPTEKRNIELDEPHPVEPSVDWTEASKGVDEAVNENSEQAETSATFEQSSSETQNKETHSKETLSKETSSKEAVAKENLNEAS
ncbi:efflux RND transporter periplasmic adaptor subunit [Vibrio sp. 10N.261.46.E12]|uniref:efflux RND transporter periplasmic adaptor subunit n=1 Tax=unclassified Vibrio TaxID=2614977 RepID=UPI000976FA26|nr:MULTISPECIES: efflux RND transporter periplasmic adaptor subunit [unclassified Vibrio]OMO34852.1 efflux transporter periplasmic adaptor subunit [Vibrio sp. 10N.261.45.E1]PMJ24282.1 efflux transporter periplasmic adaptor subunit [Vibrio sp. 10N.286.45.B6]PML85639.1 efflux transporter periplasmic adaptor subunit [Vibrio sp. 10N.261.49.E11]PMM66133.1 efflux transporter periplasmic adaptor subunit [Vibrio sp. 10N.261.46.F12]PMM81968.1 efflux transporter periplasmic adaptor subunit [Vibrio sp. 1